MLLTVELLQQFMERYRTRLQFLKDLLNTLDNRIGDGDHGSNMARGFQAASEKMTSIHSLDVGSACSTVAMTLISTVGGASGPLYGTAFLKLSGIWKGKEVVDQDLFLQGLDASLEGIQTRGKALPGEKTMVDVWDAVTSYLHGMDTLSNEVLNAAVEVAQQQALASKDRIAKKGRASYLGARSVGVCDPGSVSSAVLFEELLNTVTGGDARVAWETLVLY